MTARNWPPAMRRDIDGMRGLQRYLNEIKDLDVDGFAEATVVQMGQSPWSYSHS